MNYLEFPSAAFLQAKSLSVQCVRYRGKINIQRPREPCYEKARIIKATRPTMAPNPFNYRCVKAVKSKETVVNPYHQIIAREVRERFESAQLIVFFHKNPIKGETDFNARVAFHKQGMQLKSYGSTILRLALADTKFVSVLPLFASPSYVVFSPEPKIAEVFKTVKKFPQLILLAGVAHDRYLSKNELEALARMPSIDMVRAQFAAVLDSVGGQLVRDLQAHQTNFVGLLDQHAKSVNQTTSVEDQPTSAEESKPDDSSGGATA